MEDSNDGEIGSDWLFETTAAASRLLADDSVNQLQYNGNGNGSLDAEVETTDCEWFTFSLYVVVLGLMCSFGIVGNTISFIVLRAERHSHVATFLLQTMAVADNLFLLTTALSQMTPALTYFQAGNIDDIDQLYNSYTFMTYVKVYVWPLVHVCQMWTVWITVLVAFNRYVAICLPFQAPRLCTMRQARIQVICSVVFAWLYNVPRFLEHQLPWTADASPDASPDVNATVAPFPNFPDAVDTDLKMNFVYNIVYENILYCFFVFLGPLVILVILNTCLIRELCLARRRLHDRHLPASLSGPEQGEQNLTLVMIVIVVIFVVCQTPPFFNHLMSVIGVEDTCGRAYFYYYHLSNLLVTTNSAVNFVVYCVFRRHFRRRLRAFFCRCVGNQAATRRGSDGSLLQQWPTDTHTCDQYIGMRNASTCNSVGGGASTVGRRSMISVHRPSTSVYATCTSTPDIQMSTVKNLPIAGITTSNSHIP